MMKNSMRALRNLIQPRKDRAHDRRACRLGATMTLLARDIDLNGIVLDISPRGCLFRPELLYLVQRSGESVYVEIAGRRIAGSVAATSSSGYGIRFDEEQSIDALL